MMKRLLLAALAAVLFAHGASAKFFIARRHTTTTQTTSVLGQIYHAARLAPTTPLYYCDYTKGALCGIEDWYYRESPVYTYRNASNYITYAPNNLAPSSASWTTPHTVKVDANSNYILKCTGTGSIAYSVAASGNLSCNSEALLSPTAGNLVMTPTGQVQHVRLVKVLAETTFAQRGGVDDFDAGTQPYLPARVDKNGWLIEGMGNSNRLKYSNKFNEAVWVKESSTPTLANGGGDPVSPAGVKDAWKLTSGGSWQRIFQAVESSSGGRFTTSVRVKYDTATLVRLCAVNPVGADNCGRFNIQDGATIDLSGCPYADAQGRMCKGSIVPDPSGNGWMTLYFTTTQSARATYNSWVCPSSNCVWFSMEITSGASAYVYGFQVGQDIGLTSYIPTGPSDSGNLGEVVDITEARIGAARAVVFETASAPGRWVNARSYWDQANASNYTTTDLYSFFFGFNNRGPGGQGVSTNFATKMQTNLQHIDWWWTKDTAPTVAETTNTLNTNGANRFGVAFDSTHVSIAMNGGTPARSNQRQVPNIAVFTFATTGAWASNVRWKSDFPESAVNSYVRSVAFYRDLSDQQLRAKTVVGAAP
jgi:hypothetical protein